jgi:hypothetical protein
MADPGQGAATEPVTEQAPPPAARPTYPATGNPELDRVAAVDLAAIRDQRASQMAAAQASAPVAASDQGAGSAGKKASKPAYKQWWFWVVVGVSTLILIDIASGSDENAATTEPLRSKGPVLLRF